MQEICGIVHQWFLTRSSIEALPADNSLFVPVADPVRGHVSYSKIEKNAAVKYFAFLVVNVFFGNVLIGSAFDQLRQYLAAPTTYAPLSITYMILFRIEIFRSFCTLLL